MKLFLTSVKTCVENIPELKNLIKRDTKLIVLPFSYHKDYINCAEDIYNHFDRNPYNTESIFYETVRPFIDAGIDVDNIVIMNPYDTPTDYMIYKITRENTIVYLPGGFPENIVENIKKFKLSLAIHYAQVIVGESAGSMAPFASFFVYQDQDYKRYKSYKGLNIIKQKMTVIPHYTKDNKNIEKACRRFHRLNPRTNIYLIEDGGYIYMNEYRIFKMHKAYIWRKHFLI